MNSLILEFDLSNKTYSVRKFQLNNLKLKKGFCINQYLLKVSRLMNKDLAQIKVYIYFNIIGDAKALVEMKGK